MGSFGFGGNNSQESGQVFATNEPAAGDIPVANADGSITWTTAASILAGLNIPVVSGTPAAGSVIQASSATAAAWVTMLAAAEKMFTAKGDILVGTGAATGAILPLGSATDQLTVGGAGATGVEWAAA